jgi:TPP-dependent pyruvate/acetoin dehydrogenase alpha subunit
MPFINAKEAMQTDVLRRCREFCRGMSLIRNVETTLLGLFSKGLLNGTVHTCIGQEACAVGVISALDRRRDLVFSNHRGHGHFLAFTGDARGLIAEIMGKASGVCGGVGGSQHLQLGNFYTNGILGSGVPVAVGMALAEKTKNSGAVVVCCMGDGTFGEGVVYEAMNIAALWRLPILFVVENNGYAQSTPSHVQHAGDLQRRAEPFGIPVVAEDGMDVVKVFAAAESMVGAIRRNCRPQLLFLSTYRFAPHSKGDDTRDKAEIEQHRQRDPLRLIGEYLDSVTLQQIEEQARAEVETIVTQLTASS